MRTENPFGGDYRFQVSKDSFTGTFIEEGKGEIFERGLGLSSAYIKLNWEDYYAGLYARNYRFVCELERKVFGARFDTANSGGFDVINELRVLRGEVSGVYGYDGRLSRVEFSISGEDQNKISFRLLLTKDGWAPEYGMEKMGEPVFINNTDLKGDSSDPWHHEITYKRERICTMEVDEERGIIKVVDEKKKQEFGVQLERKIPGFWSDKLPLLRKTCLDSERVTCYDALKLIKEVVATVENRIDYIKLAA